MYNRGYADEHDRLAVHEWLDGYEYAQNSFDKVTDEEVLFSLHKLKVGKAVGRGGGGRWFVSRNVKNVYEL